MADKIELVGSEEFKKKGSSLTGSSKRKSQGGL